MRQLTAIALLLLAILTMPCMHSTAFAELDADKSFETDIKEFLPNQIDKGLELAKRYIAMERFDLAERFYKTMFDSKPIDWRVYYYYSDFLIRLNRIKEAVEVLETCTEERGISAYDIHITLGALYFRDQNYRKSAREYKRAASVNHIYPEPLFYWAVSAIFQGLEGEPTEAIQTMEKRFPGSPYLAFAKAVYAYYSGKFEEADALVATITDDSTMPAFYHVFRSALDRKSVV